MARLEDLRINFLSRSPEEQQRFIEEYRFKRENDLKTVVAEFSLDQPKRNTTVKKKATTKRNSTKKVNLKDLDDTQKELLRKLGMSV